jgi:hypothetical protein
MKFYRGISMIMMTLVIGAIVMSSTQDASALFVLTLDDLGTAGIDAIIADDEAIGTSTKKGNTNTHDGYGGLGVIQFSGSLGSFIVNVTTGISKPIIGSSKQATMDLNSVNVSGGVGTLEITLTDTDFLLSTQPSPPPYELTSRVGGTTGGTVEFEQFVDRSNNEFGIGPPAPDIVSLPLQGPFTGGAFSDTLSTFFDLGVDEFSITERVKITHTAALQLTSFDAETQVHTPEPTTLLLVACGLAGLAGYSWRRRKQQS